MKNILIVDTETTGLPSPDKEVNIIEIAAILYSVEHRSILQQAASVFPVESNDAYKTNKISVELAKQSTLHTQFHELLGYMYYTADYIVAHNADFDRGMLKQYVNDWSLKHNSGLKPWICTCHDFVWPDMKLGPKRLVDIALELGLPVFAAHRALIDCQLLAECLSRVEDLPDRLKKAAMPRSLYRAMVSYEQRQLAKDAGFQWNGVAKQWEARLSDEDAKTINNFKVFKVKDINNEMEAS